MSIFRNWAIGGADLLCVSTTPQVAVRHRRHNPTPHDALFKATFSQPEHAAGALRAALPPALAASLNFRCLTLCPGSFIDATLANSHADLLFSTRLHRQRALIYVLFEHRSKPDRWMPFRMLKYMVRIWDGYLQEHPRAKKLPAIIPIVLHHGRRGWTAAVTFEELLDLDERTRSAMAEHLPRLRLLVDDLSPQRDAALRARAMTALARLVLICLKHARDPETMAASIARCSDLIQEILRAPNGTAAFSVVVAYLHEIGGEQPVKKLLELTAGTTVGKELEDTMLSYAEQLRREGVRKGVRVGVRKGRRDALLRLLHVRFGALSEPVVSRVKAAKKEQLDAWLERILTASSLEEVLGATG